MLQMHFLFYKVSEILGLHDISNAMIMHFSSVKPVPWSSVNLHHLLSDGAAFITPSRRSLTGALECLRVF